MKNKLFVITIIMGCFILSGCSNEEKTILNEDFVINTVETENCNNKVVEYYTLNNQSVYLVCLENIVLEYDNFKITLKNYLTKDGNTIDSVIEKIINKLTLEDGLWDGGTTIYRNNDITIIKCNTLDENKDVYIGNESMDEDYGFQNGFCGK
jgi:6-phosphogluconate dehydrogenase